MFKTSLLLLMLCTSSVALAEEPPKSEVVYLKDLNLNTPEGLQRARNRIYASAENVCGKNSTFYDAELRRIYLTCVKETTDATMQKILRK